MTVNTISNKVTAVGNGVTTAFTINFQFYIKADLVVTFDTVQISSGLYNVTGGGGSTGTLTFLTPPANGVAIEISRILPLVQQAAFTRNDPFPAKTHEIALDRIVMMMQQISGGSGGGSGDISPEFIQDTVAAMFGGVQNGLTVVYDDPSGIMTFTVTSPGFNDAPANGVYYLRRNNNWFESSWNNLADKPSTFTPIAHTHTSSDITDFAEASQDTIASMFTHGSNTGISFTYDDASNRLLASVTSSLLPNGDYGDIISSLNGVQLTIDSGAITLGKMANITGPTILGKVTGTNIPETLTPDQATSILSVFTTSAKGLVPSSPGGTSQYLRADGSWFTPSVSGGATLADGDYGDILVTGSGTVMTIDTDVVTNAKLANMAANTVKGSIAGGDPNDLTQTQLTTLINQFTSVLKGAVPASGGGTANFLRADGTWVAPSASVAWGSITGTLASQTDLNTALNGKQPVDNTLTSLSALGTAADKIAYTTGVDTWAEATQTAFARTLIDDIDATAARATLGLVIGTNVQAFDSDLTTIAGLTATTDNIIQSVSSAWASRTPAQVTATLPAVVGDSGSGGAKGLAPATGAGDAAANKFLKADGTWQPAETLGEYIAINAITASTTLALTDKGKLVTANHASVAIVITVPPNSSVAFPVKSKIDLASLGAAQVSVAQGAGVTIRSSGSKVKLTGQYSGASLTKIATDEWLLVGDLTT